MIATVTTTSNREKIEQSILAKEPKEIPPPYVPLYMPLPLGPHSTLISDIGW
jgi:hypothetical protein